MNALLLLVCMAPPHSTLRPCDAQANAPAAPVTEYAGPIRQSPAPIKATERTLINGVWVVTREWTEPTYTPPVYPVTPAVPPYQPPAYPITPYYPTYRPGVSAGVQFGGFSAGASYCPPGKP